MNAIRISLKHRLESYVYADAAARTGQAAFVAGDIGRIAYQSDNGAVLAASRTDSPAWTSIVTQSAVQLLCRQYGDASTSRHRRA